MLWQFYAILPRWPRWIPKQKNKIWDLLRNATDEQDFLLKSEVLSFILILSYPSLILALAYPLGHLMTGKSRIPIRYTAISYIVGWRNMIGRIHSYNGYNKVKRCQFDQQGRISKCKKKSRREGKRRKGSKCQIQPPNEQRGIHVWLIDQRKTKKQMAKKKKSSLYFREDCHD